MSRKLIKRSRNSLYAMIDKIMYSPDDRPNKHYYTFQCRFPGLCCVLRTCVERVGRSINIIIIIAYYDFVQHSDSQEETFSSSSQCILTNTHTHTYTHTHTHVHTRTHAHMHAHTHAHMHAHTHIHTHARTHARTRTHTMSTWTA